MVRKNKLAAALEPFRQIEELRPHDYAALGAAVIGISYEDEYVRRHYGLKASRPAEPPLVDWERGESDFVMAERAKNTEYTLYCRKRIQGTDSSKDVINIFAFGLEPKDGLVRFVHVITNEQLDEEDFMAHGREAGKITKDSSRLMRVEPKLTDKTIFRKAVFGILESQIKSGEAH